MRENGRIVRVFGNIVDNTEQKRAEEELNRAHQTFLTVTGRDRRHGLCGRHGHAMKSCS
ncbi:MAG: hypothetical protein MZU95_00795 [Desulfomicrobium escambiense]|nr:hypothetical protein [Desulfomicrobium escambiense]